MRKLTKKDLKRIKYFRVISDNEVLIAYKGFETKQIIKGKVFREKLHFPEEQNLKLL